MSAYSSKRLRTGVDGGTQQCRKWMELGLYPRGVQATRERADALPLPPTAQGLRRMTVDDVKALQGFPAEWQIWGPPSHQLGQLGNAVPPPLAAALARALRAALVRT